MSKILVDRPWLEVGFGSVMVWYGLRTTSSRHYDQIRGNIRAKYIGDRDSNWWEPSCVLVFLLLLGWLWHGHLLCFSIYLLKACVSDLAPGMALRQGVLGWLRIKTLEEVSLFGFCSNLSSSVLMVGVGTTKSEIQDPDFLPCHKLPQHESEGKQEGQLGTTKCDCGSQGNTGEFC